MPERILDHIKDPSDIKSLSYIQLIQLASELREEMIGVTSRNGGHLAPSLGVVELTIALLRVLDLPKDKLVFDVGHQAYAYKLLTGRLDRFDTLRTLGGISGFPKIEESIYDCHDSGHASDSLSTALGMAVARDLDGGDERIVALIGDGALSSGLAFEGMNMIGQLHTNMTIILNDNKMSISRNVGALAQYLTDVRVSPYYISASQKLTKRMSAAKDPVTQGALRAGLVFKDSLKRQVLPGIFFEELGMKYLGPVNGHDIAHLENIIRSAQDIEGPVMIHVVTTKGEGYAPAKDHPDIFHGIGPFDETTGEVKTTDAPPSYTQIFADTLVAEAEHDPSIVAITAAMQAGTGIDHFMERFPSRCFDVGITEEHAVTFASGLALSGKKPVVAIYSTFLQRAFDEIIINVALQRQHVVFAIDRAGIVGADGPTHHGAFDLVYMRLVPGMKVIAPSDERELADAIHTALALDGPVAVRYPRGHGRGVAIPAKREMLPLGQGFVRREGGDVAFLALGDMVGVALDAAALLEEGGISARVVDMRWAKPIDDAAVAQAAACKLVVTLEDGVIDGGFGSAVLEALSALGLEAETLVLGLPDKFIEQGDTPSLLDMVGLSAAKVAARVRERLADIDGASASGGQASASGEDGAGTPEENKPGSTLPPSSRPGMPRARTRHSWASRHHMPNDDSKEHGIS